MRRRVCDMKSAVDHKKKRSIVGGRLPADEQAPRASTPQRQPRQRSILEPLTRRAWRSRRRRRSAHATALSTGNRCAALNALTSDWLATDSALEHRPKLKAQEKQEKPPVQRPASSRTPCVKTSIDGVSHTPPPPTALESCVQVLLVCECSKAPLARKLRCLQPQVSCRQLPLQASQRWTGDSMSADRSPMTTRHRESAQGFRLWSGGQNFSKVGSAQSV